MTKARSIFAVIILVAIAASMALAADDAAGTLQRAQELFTAGQYAQADAKAREAIAAGGDTALLCGAADVVILCKLSQGDFDGAKQAAQDLKAQIADTAAQAYLDEQISDIEAKKAAYQQTIADLEATLSANPDRELGASAAYKIGGAKLAWGRQSEALAAFQRVVDEFRFSDRALLARLAMGGIHERAGRYSDAQAAYDQIVQHSPDSPYAAQAVAGIKAARLAQDDVLGAKEQMADIIIAHPDTEASAMAMYCKGEILLYEGRADEGKAALDDVARERHNTIAGGAAVVRRANTLMSEGASLTAERKYHEAISKYTEILDLAPDTYYARQALIHIGHNYGWARDRTQAVASYEKVLRDYPQSAEALVARYYRARFRESSEDFSGAIEDAQAVVASDTDPYRLATSYYRLGRCYVETKEFEKARDALQVLVANDHPKFQAWHGVARYWIGYSYYKQVDYEKALDHLRPILTDYEGQIEADMAQSVIAEIESNLAHPGQVPELQEADSEEGE